MKKSHVFDPRHIGVLEIEERRLWENPGKVLSAVEVKPNFVVADLGCGSGFFTIPTHFFLASFLNEETTFSLVTEKCSVICSGLKSLDKYLENLFP